MMQEQKELLLKDLCARLPYGVKVNNEIQGDFEIYGVCENLFFARSTTNHADFHIEKIKPYLFPLSSMTEEQNKELDQAIELELKAISGEIDHEQATAFEVDFYNKHHFDWRGLIPMGLAIDVTGLNIY